MWGTNDAELYIRWFQFGALSPILRLHSTRNSFEEKLPWKFGMFFTKEWKNEILRGKRMEEIIDF